MVRALKPDSEQDKNRKMELPVRDIKLIESRLSRCGAISSTSVAVKMVKGFTTF